MPTLKLDFLVVPTYNIETLGVVDASTYPTDPPSVSAPSLDVTVPGFGKVSGIPFIPLEFNIVNSTILGLTIPGDPLLPLPDGVYTLRYSVAPAYANYVEKNIMRVDKLQEKFDNAFMKLDMMECDKAIKTQAKVDLTTVYFFIQGSIAAANSCAVIESEKLYNQANKMLDRFIKNNCGCSGSNYINTF